jgi:hypothetical protein
VSHERFYRLGSLLPLAVPASIASVGALLWRGGRVLDLSQFPPPVQLLFAAPLYLWFSLLFGGVPYVFFAAVSLWALRGKSSAAYLRFTLLAPLLFAALLALLVPVLYLAKTRALAADDLFPMLQLSALFSVPAVVIGYGYVGVLHLLRPHFTDRAPEQLPSAA